METSFTRRGLTGALISAIACGAINNAHSYSGRDIHGRQWGYGNPASGFSLGVTTYSSSGSRSCWCGDGGLLLSLKDNTVGRVMGPVEGLVSNTTLRINKCLTLNKGIVYRDWVLTPSAISCPLQGAVWQYNAAAPDWLSTVTGDIISNENSARVPICGRWNTARVSGIRKVNSGLLTRINQLYAVSKRLLDSDWVNNTAALSYPGALRKFQAMPSFEYAPNTDKHQKTGRNGIGGVSFWNVSPQALFRLWLWSLLGLGTLWASAAPLIALARIDHPIRWAVSLISLIISVPLLAFAFERLG